LLIRYAGAMQTPATQTPATQTPAPEAELFWKSGDAPVRLWDMLVGSLTLTAYFALIMQVVGLIALLLVTPFVLWRGEDWFQIASGWLDGDLWLGGLSIALALGVAPMLIHLLPQLESFRFDASARKLEIVQRVAIYGTRRKSIAFEQISSILPLSYDGGGGGLFLQLERGSLVLDCASRLELDAWAHWLKQHLGDRVQPVEERIST
jgi:hypothetical protein